MAVKIKKVQPKASITVTEKKGEVETKTETEENVGEPIESQEQLANVGLRMSMKWNLGNYESVGAEVSLFFPCTPNPEAIDSTFDAVKEWVDTKLNVIGGEVQTAMDQNAGGQEASPI